MGKYLPDLRWFFATGGLLDTGLLELGDGENPFLFLLADGLGGLEYETSTAGPLGGDWLEPIPSCS